MNRISMRTLAILCIVVAGTGIATQAAPAEHVVVYKHDGHFAGWPANNGIWVWRDEIVVGFILGGFRFVEGEDHPIDPDKPELPRFARSLDGGQTWSIEIPSFLDEKGGQRTPIERSEPVDFSHPDFAMRLRQNRTPPGHSRIYYSHDRCRTWEGPYKLPLFGQKEIMARTDYLVNGPHDAMAFVTAAKQDGQEGRVFCTRTIDGGQSWRFISWIGPEPKGFAIMPATIRLSPTNILTTLRRQEGTEHWIDAYRSTDNGKTWRLVKERLADTGASEGNASSLNRLTDGRLVLTYGYRAVPYGIRARISRDDGVTWSTEIVLRDDAGCWDLGYPATAQRADGKLVTVYYYNDAPDEERYIAATIWQPGE